MIELVNSDRQSNYSHRGRIKRIKSPQDDYEKTIQREGDRPVFSLAVLKISLINRQSFLRTTYRHGHKRSLATNNPQELVDLARASPKKGPKNEQRFETPKRSSSLV